MQTTPRKALAYLARAILLVAAGTGVWSLVQAQEETTPQPAQESAPERADEAPIVEAPEGAAVLEDYEASEQISEDLSVSFPVDI